MSAKAAQSSTEGMRTMNDLFLLEPEYRYHAERARNCACSPSATVAGAAGSEDGQTAAKHDKNWIS